jgi:hypothetical protein
MAMLMLAKQKQAYNTSRQANIEGECNSKKDARRKAKRINDREVQTTMFTVPLQRYQRSKLC